MPETNQTTKWHGHEGVIVASANSFEVIDCNTCRFKHIVPIPSAEELETIYRHDYYSQEKPFYIDRYLEDKDWWHLVNSQRYEMLEQHLPENRRSLLDIGSGPGLFLECGHQRGWRVKGIEPSLQASEYCRSVGLDVVSGQFSETTAAGLGCFDAINLSLVLEHIPDPTAFLNLVHRHLSTGGLISIVVPNDFNPFQRILQHHLGFDPWWIAPPHHINYFNFESLAKLVEYCGFEVLHQQATFPIDLFLLMGDNYVGNDEMGRACHKKRMNFEKALCESGSGQLLISLQSALAGQGLGREVVVFARKISA